MKLETIKELHRHHAGIVAALRKEIEEAEREAAQKCQHGIYKGYCAACEHTELLNANPR